MSTRRTARSSDVVAELRRQSTGEERAKVGTRLGAGEAVFGLRMRDLFGIAKAHSDLPLDEVDALLDEAAYEPRLAAFCILDFKARRRLSEEERRDLYDMYLRRHDRITSWDMVDRAAPRVVGGHLAGRSLEPLVELARSEEPLERRTAITAPLLFCRQGSDSDLAGGFDIAGRLATDPVGVVHNAVGIFLKHAGTRDPDALRRFLDVHASAMPRPALRLAIEKLDPTTRTRYLRGAA
jgi:3-methyladenine DNA glycosylase AlkD